MSTREATDLLKASQLGLFGGGGGGGGERPGHKYIKRTSAPGSYHYDYGNTASGKPIQGSFDHAAHASFGGQDHADAASAHAGVVNAIIDTHEDSADRREHLDKHRAEMHKHADAAAKFGTPAAGLPYADKPRNTPRPEATKPGDAVNAARAAANDLSADAHRIGAAANKRSNPAHHELAATAHDKAAAAHVSGPLATEHRDAAKSHRDEAAGFKHLAGERKAAKKAKAAAAAAPKAPDPVDEAHGVASKAVQKTMAAREASAKADKSGDSTDHQLAHAAHKAAGHAQREASSAFEKPGASVSIGGTKFSTLHENMAKEHDEKAHGHWIDSVNARSDEQGEPASAAATHKVGGEAKSHVDKLHEAVANLKPEKMTKREHFEGAHAKFKALHDHLETKLGFHEATAHASKAAGLADMATHSMGSSTDKASHRHAREVLGEAQERAKRAVETAPEHVRKAPTQGRHQEAAAEAAGGGEKPPPKPKKSGAVSIGETSSGKTIHATHASAEDFNKHTKGWSGKDHEEAAIAHRSTRSHHTFAADKIARGRTEGADKSHATHRALSEHHGDMTGAHESVASSERVKATGEKPSGPRSWDQIAHDGVKDAFKSADEGHKMRGYSPDMHKSPEGKGAPKFDAKENAALEARVRGHMGKSMDHEVGISRFQDRSAGPPAPAGLYDGLGAGMGDPTVDRPRWIRAPEAAPVGAGARGVLDADPARHTLAYQKPRQHGATLELAKSAVVAAVEDGSRQQLIPAEDNPVAN